MEKQRKLPQAIFVDFSVGVFGSTPMQGYYYLTLPNSKGHIVYQMPTINWPHIWFKVDTWEYIESSPHASKHDLHWYINNGRAMWLSSTPPSTENKNS